MKVQVARIMADNYSIDIAISHLDELVDGAGSIIKRGGFDREHKGIIWMLKGWIKVAVLANHPDYHKQATAYFVMKRDPAPFAGSRSKALLRDMDAFRTMLSNHRITHGDYFNRVDSGLRDFVWEYRKHLNGKSATDFESKLMNLRSISKEELMKEVLFKMDQHA
jgi:hypothetical protein